MEDRTQDARVGPAPKMEPQGETFSPVKNTLLQAIDAASQASGLRPEDQAGVLIIATVMAMRRICEAHGIEDRGRRQLIRKTAVLEFDSKCRKFLAPEAPSPLDPVEEPKAPAGPALLVPAKPALVIPGKLPGDGTECP